MSLAYLVTALTNIVFSAPIPQKIVGYFPSWGPGQTPPFTWKEIDYTQVTHIAWSFVYPAADGSLLGLESPDDADHLDSLVFTAHAHNVKVIVSLGGAGQCDGFAPMAKNEASRAKFSQAVKQLVVSHHLDGADIDWEYEATPTPQDTAAYTKLVRELRDSLGQNFLLSAALPASDWTGKWFSTSGFIGSLDWVGIMTYDMTGGWDGQAGYNSPLFNNPRSGVAHDVADISVSTSMAYWSTKKGVPKSKLLFGQPSYGFVFANGTVPGAAFTGVVTYTDTKDLGKSMGSWAVHWDDTAKALWATTPAGGYATWDDSRTAGLKAHWAKDNGYAGAIVWELSQDYSVNAGHPILDSLSRVLLGVNGSSVMAKSRTWSSVRLSDGSIVVELAPTEKGRLVLHDLAGHIFGEIAGIGPKLRLQPGRLGPGIYLLRLSINGSVLTPQLIPLAKASED